MQEVTTPSKKPKGIKIPKEQSPDAINKRRVHSKRIDLEKRRKLALYREQIITALVIIGLFGLIVASLLKNGLFLKEIVASSLIIGGVLFVRAFGQSTAHKA